MQRWAAASSNMRMKDKGIHSLVLQSTRRCCRFMAHPTAEPKRPKALAVLVLQPKSITHPASTISQPDPPAHTPSLYLSTPFHWLLWCCLLQFPSRWPSGRTVGERRGTGTGQTAHCPLPIAIALRHHIPTAPSRTATHTHPECTPLPAHSATQPAVAARRQVPS